MELIKFTWRRSICAPLVTLQMSKRYWNSSHVGRNCELSTLAMTCEIRSGRDCGIEDCYTWPFIYCHR
jgi:hypothetical protein